jgi:hypothetical protein
MVRHADKQKQPDVVLLDPFGKPLQKPRPVSVVFEEERLFRTPIPHHPARDVVNRSGILNSQLSGHAPMLAQLLPACKVYCEGLTLIPLLVVFRNRLVEGAQECLAFAAVLDYLVEHGWVPKRSRQRLDSTHVRGLLSVMNRLECARETLRLLLEDLEADDAFPSPTGVTSQHSTYGLAIQESQPLLC